MEPPLRLDRLYYTDFSIKANKASPGEQSNFGLTTTPGLLRSNDDPDSWVVTLRLKIDQGDKGAVPYDIEFEIWGEFTVTKPRESEAETARMVAVNGLSILYSAAREAVFLFTSRGPWGGFHLPTVSFADMQPGERRKISDSLPEEKSVAE
jgi:preprotein translocase subunit SecB